MAQFNGDYVSNLSKYENRGKAVLFDRLSLMSLIFFSTNTTYSQSFPFHKNVLVY